MKVENYFGYDFVGFESLNFYKENTHLIPESRGYYIILSNNTDVVFQEKGSAGYFKGRDPNMSVEFLKNRWISNTHILFIGQAGRSYSRMTLRKKIKKLIAFGEGKNEAHFQGRYIWQINFPMELILAWIGFNDSEIMPTLFVILKKFYEEFDGEPFANPSNNMKNNSNPYFYPKKIKDAIAFIDRFENDGLP